MAAISCGQQLRRVLQVGVHHAENRRIGVPPAVENGAGQAALAFADQQAHARVLLGDGGDDLLGSVAAVVIDDQNFVGRFPEDRARSGRRSRRPREVFGLAQGGNDQRQLLLARVSGPAAGGCCVAAPSAAV